MSRRVTITITQGLDTAVRNKQAEYIKKHNSSYSYSAAIGDILKRGLK